MSTDEAAQVLGVTVRAVRYMVTDGRLSYLRVGRAFLLSRDEVNRMADLRRPRSQDGGDESRL